MLIIKDWSVRQLSTEKLWCTSPMNVSLCVIISSILISFKCFIPLRATSSRCRQSSVLTDPWFHSLYCPSTPKREESWWSSASGKLDEDSKNGEMCSSRHTTVWYHLAVQFVREDDDGHLSEGLRLCGTIYSRTIYVPQCTEKAPKSRIAFCFVFPLLTLPAAAEWCLRICTRPTTSDAADCDGNETKATENK